MQRHHCRLHVSSFLKFNSHLSNNLASLSTNKCNITWCPNKQTIFKITLIGNCIKRCMGKVTKRQCVVG